VTIVARRTTVRLTGPDGVTWEGEGDGFAAALLDLARCHRRGEPAAAQGAARWVLTAKGRRAVAQLRQRDEGGR
jgi:hypothetical protein